MNHCSICFIFPVDDNMICDLCDEHYCEDCSYTFTLHYQYQGSRCYQCSGQNRIKKLNKEDIRQNKIELTLIYS